MGLLGPGAPENAGVLNKADGLFSASMERLIGVLWGGRGQYPQL